MKCINKKLSVNANNAVFWNGTPCGNRRFERRQRLHQHIIKVAGIGELGTTLAVTSNRSRLRRNKRATRRNITEDGILDSYRREHLKSYTALTGSALRRRHNAFPVRYELGFSITDDGILHSHRRENLKSYIALMGWVLQWRRNVSPVR
jgi:hypothetical protein